MTHEGVENGKISVAGVGCVCDPVDGGDAANEMVRKPKMDQWRQGTTEQVRDWGFAENRVKIHLKD